MGKSVCKIKIMMCEIVSGSTSVLPYFFSCVLQAKQSLATLTKDVPKRQSLVVQPEPVVNGSQEWVMQADLPLTAAIRQSQQTLYHGHNADRQGKRSPSSRSCSFSMLLGVSFNQQTNRGVSWGFLN